jgi:hypothetical protein
MTNDEKLERAKTCLLAIQVLEKEMQTIFYQLSQFNDTVLSLLNRSTEYIANNIEIIDAHYIAAMRIVKEDK